MNSLSWLNRRPRKDAELREELEFHASGRRGARRFRIAG